MAVQQREIVEVNYQLPNGQFKPPPVIVISWLFESVFSYQIS